MKNLHSRLLFGTLMLVGLAALLYCDHMLPQWHHHPGCGINGLLFAALVALLVVGGTAELAGLARAKNLKPLAVTGAVVAVALALSPYLVQVLSCRCEARGSCAISQSATAHLPLLILALGTLLIFFVQAARRRIADAIPNIAATLLGVCYLGGLGFFVMQMRLDFGILGLLVYLAVVKCTDVGAYFVGSRFGRHKMIPWLSPGKSWEGLAGGMAGAVIAALALGLATGFFTHWWSPIVFGLVMAPMGQLADLAESLLKRDSGLKDSGRWIPGFGGLLDVLDSPLGAAPVGYLLLMMLR